jgi:anti-sigma regulatory factor (Ser/Thr protein kinase)/putative methionine-R-sulfoxide reductase with GAF domain
VESSAEVTGEQAATVAADLRRVTEGTLAYLDLDDLLSELLERSTKILAADTAAILLLEEDGRTLAARAAKGLEAEVERGFKLPIGAGFAGTVAATLAPVTIEDLDASPIRVVNPLFREVGVRSLLGVPMVVEGRLIGVLHVGSLSPGTFSEDHVHLLQTVADRAALSIEHHRLALSHRVVEALQRGLLPERLPWIPELGFAARYIPAAQAGSVGGDWYDVAQLRDGRVAIAVGDVVGHGVAAASLMGELRTALRVYGLEGLGPVDAIDKLAGFVFARGIVSMATCAYATVDLDRSRVTLATAGHPPPLLVTPDGARFIDQAAGPPLGASTHHRYEQTEFTIGPGEILILYTDGLIERRGHRLSEGLAELAAAASGAPFDAELMCERLIASMPPDGSDDVAVLTMQNVATAAGDLALRLSARPDQLIVVRRALRRWLSAVGATDADVSATVIAANEACSNAIEHAYALAEASFAVEARRDDESIEVTVSDSGSWREARGDDRGRGLDLIRATMDEVEVMPSSRGTTVRLVRKLGRQEL